jgi:hypothetical protein
MALHREVKTLRADVQESLRLELGRQVRADLERALADANGEHAGPGAQALVLALTQRLEAQRAADQQTFLAALQSLGAGQARDYAELRKELETVAVLTEAGLQRAQNQIATLAYVPSADNSSDHQ